MLDRLLYRWLPLLFVVFCILALLPGTSAPLMRYIVKLLHYIYL